MEDNVLVHYGILGMKWGVRRTPAQLARAREKTKSSSSNSDEKKSVKDMSDDELRRRLNRINMEDQYNAAMARRNPDKFQRAKKVVADLAEQAVRNVATKAITKAVEKAFESKKPSDPITKYADKKISEMTDKELASAVKRASSEKTLRNLIDELNKK